MRIRKLRSWRHADREPFRLLDRRCFPTDEPFLNGRQYSWWVLWSDRGEPLGYAGLYVRGDEAHFSRCGIVPSARGFGLQRRLLRARVSWCRRRNLRVCRTYTCIDNWPSRKNLEHEGFVPRRSPCGKYILYKLELN